MKRNLEAAREVRRQLEIVCRKLECPTLEALEATAEELNLAVRGLQSVEASLRLREANGSEADAGGGLENELRAIRRELSRAQALVRATGRFLQVWGGLLGQEEAGENYTLRGMASVSVEPSQVVAHG